MDSFGLDSQELWVTDSTPAMTVRDVAAHLNVNEKTVYRLAQRGELPGFKVAGAWRFQKSDLEEWIRERKRKGALRGANGE